jgi:hypothetical protein
MKLATIASLLGVVVVTILATTAAHATSKNNPAIEDCFNKSSTNLNMQFITEMAQNVGNPAGMMNGQPFNGNHTLIAAIQQDLTQCLIQYNK